MLCDITANENSLKINPQILHDKPVFYNLCRTSEFCDPLLNFCFKRRVIPTIIHKTSHNLVSVMLKRNITASIKLCRYYSVVLNSEIVYLLLINDPNIIKLSSMRETISEVSPPLSKNSPRFLNVPKENIWVLQSATTPFNFASISFSFTAAMQMSYREINMGCRFVRKPTRTYEASLFIATRCNNHVYIRSSVATPLMKTLDSPGVSKRWVVNAIRLSLVFITLCLNTTTVTKHN